MMHTRLRPPFPSSRIIVCALLPLAASCSRDSAPPIQRLTREVGGARLTEARLSISTSYAPCAAAPGTGSCGLVPPASDEVADISGAAIQSLRLAEEPGALHAQALVELMWPSTGNSASLSISSLQAAARLADDPAPLLSDISAVYLHRASADPDVRYYLEAAEYASAALERDSTFSPARFNLALALTRLGLASQARREWRRVISADPGSGWAREAEMHLRSLVPVSVARPSISDGEAALRDFARREPQDARLWMMDEVLGDWGRAVESGDSARARMALAAAAAVGRQLSEQGGDRSVAECVSSINRAPGRGETRRLARAHRLYVEARSAGAAADSMLQEAAALASGSSPGLRGWARADRLRGLLAGPGMEQALSELGAMAGSDTIRFPALAARARWMRGLTYLREGQPREGLPAVAGAVRLWQRLGEREHEAWVRVLKAEGLQQAGDDDATFADFRRAAELLRNRPPSMARHNHLQALSRAASGMGVRRAALRILDENVAVAGQLTVNQRAEALLKRAQVLISAGNLARADSDIRAGRAKLDSLPEGNERAWYRQDFQVATAAIARRRGTPVSATFLDPVVGYFGSSVRAEARLIPALLERSELRMAGGDAAGVEEDLARAIAVLDTMAEGVERVLLRASMLETRRSVFDRLTMMHVRAHRAEAALAVVERGRASLSSARRGTAGRPRRDEVVLEYALIGDTLLIWTIRGSRTELHRSLVRRDGLIGAAELLRQRLQDARSTEQVLNRDLEELYRILIRPIVRDLEGSGRLVVIADGEIGGIPFAALRSPESGRYLVETHEIRFAPSLADAFAGRSRPSEGRPAVFVVDPAFAPGAAGLRRLRATAASAAATAALYSPREVIRDTAAREPAVRRALSRAGLFHFAGHAVFDGERPERSYLLLAGDGEDGRLTAEELEGQDLRGLDLVVLSACETQRGRGSRQDGLMGLSGVMLRAGAGGVVGSLWRVDERATGELMVRFHRAYRASGTAAGALRSAQLEMLSDPALRTPAAWAGFRYAGR